jgi:hypothetical protein
LALHSLTSTVTAAWPAHDLTHEAARVMTPLPHVFEHWLNAPLSWHE